MENALKWPVSRTTTWKHLFDVLFVSQTRSVHASIGLCFHTGGLKVIWIGVWTPHEWDQMQYFCMSENLKVIYLRGNQCVRTCSAYIMFDSQYVFILYHSTPYTHMNQKLHTSHIYTPIIHAQYTVYIHTHLHMVVFPCLPCRVIDPTGPALFALFRGQDDQPDVFGEALQCLHAQISREISKRVVNKTCLCFRLLRPY